MSGIEGGTFVLTCADMRAELSEFGDEAPIEIDVLRNGAEVSSIAATVRRFPYLELQYSRQGFTRPLASNGSEFFFPQLGSASDGLDLLLAEREGLGRCGDAPMLSHCSAETCSTTCFGRPRSLVRMSRVGGTIVSSSASGFSIFSAGLHADAGAIQRVGEVPWDAGAPRALAVAPNGTAAAALSFDDRLLFFRPLDGGSLERTQGEPCLLRDLQATSSALMLRCLGKTDGGFPEMVIVYSWDGTLRSSYVLGDQGERVYVAPHHGRLFGAVRLDGGIQIRRLE